MTDQNEIPRDRFVENLCKIQKDKFTIWKHFEDRADQLGQRLWITGTWLMSLLAATLALPFVSEFIFFSNTVPPIGIKSRFVVSLIALFGVAFCVYSYVVLRDIREHIEGNWRRSSYVLTDSFEANWGGRKSHGWNILIAIGIFAFLGFLALLALSLLPSTIHLTKP